TYLTYITLGVFVGSALRFVAHYVAGIVFFGSAVEGQPAVVLDLGLLDDGPGVIRRRREDDDLLVDAVLDHVVRLFPEPGKDLDVQARLLEDFAFRGLLPGLPGLDVAFRETPVGTAVVLDDEEAGLPFHLAADDGAARRLIVTADALRVEEVHRLRDIVVDVAFAFRRNDKVAFAVFLDRRDDAAVKCFHGVVDPHNERVQRFSLAGGDKIDLSVVQPVCEPFFGVLGMDRRCHLDPDIPAKHINLRVVLRT
ncbi:MAG: energy-coupled thiamine transporter ThiT, partial [Clostridia bacterium]|nr:energy-coupled thiamine transporter ThiT [Clostridia bacterium]